MSGPTELAHQLDSPHVVVDVRSHLQLQMGEPLRQGIAHEPEDLLVGVTQPAGRRGVGGITSGHQMSLPFLLPPRGPGQPVHRFVGVEDVAQVPEVDQGDDLGRGEAGEELPQGQAVAAGVKVPDRVDDGPDGHVGDPFFGAEPAQLAVVGEQAPEATHVRQDLVHVQADDQRFDGADSRHRHLVAPPDGEDETIAVLASGGVDDHVSRRVVGVLVHGVRTVEGTRRREADVAEFEMFKPCGHDSAAASPPPRLARIKAKRIVGHP